MILPLDVHSVDDLIDWYMMTRAAFKWEYGFTGVASNELMHCIL
jgi:hypothetical protein